MDKILFYFSKIPVLLKNKPADSFTAANYFSTNIPHRLLITVKRIKHMYMIYKRLIFVLD